MLEVGHRNVLEMDCGSVEGRGLIEAVIERVQQSVIKTEAAADCGLAVAPHVPGKADARRGQKLGAVVRERGTADDGLRLQHAVDERVVRCATLCFIPAVGRLGAETGAQLQVVASP